MASRGARRAAAVAWRGAREQLLQRAVADDRALGRAEHEDAVKGAEVVRLVHGDERGAPFRRGGQLAPDVRRGHGHARVARALVVREQAAHDALRTFGENAVFAFLAKLFELR